MTETKGGSLGHSLLGNGCFDKFDQFMVLAASSGRGRLNGFECVWGNPSRIVLESIASLTPNSRTRCAGRRCQMQTGPDLSMPRQDRKRFLHCPVSRRSLVLTACQIGSSLRRTPWWSLGALAMSFISFSLSRISSLFAMGNWGQVERVRKCDLTCVFRGVLGSQ